MILNHTHTKISGINAIFAISQFYYLKIVINIECFYIKLIFLTLICISSSFSTLVANAITTLVFCKILISP